MKKSIVYASTTGNTEAMANAVLEGAKSSGSETCFFTADSADAAEVVSADVIYLGSPAMGDEVLEDSMEEFYSSIEGYLSGKKVAVFGSYDWGDGKWLRDWTERLSASGAEVINGEGTKCQNTPDDDGLEECRKLGSM